MTPQKGDKSKVLRVRRWAEVLAALAPIQEAPPTPGEMERRKMEAEKLGEVGRLPVSSLIQQLTQMATEARPSMLGVEELA